MIIKKVLVALVSVGFLSLAIFHQDFDYRQLTYIEDGKDDCDVNPIGILVLMLVMIVWVFTWLVYLF